MSGEAIITLIAVAVILVVFGIPLYVVRHRNRIQAEEVEAEQSNEEASSMNATEPRLTQEPAVTSGPVAVDPSPVPPVNLNPVPPVKPARRRVEKKATAAPVAEKKTTRRSKPKADIPSKALKKALKEVADMDKSKPVLSKEFATRKGLRLDEKKTKTTKTVKKSAPKTKKSK